MERLPEGLHHGWLQAWVFKDIAFMMVWMHERDENLTLDDMCAAIRKKKWPYTNSAELTPQSLDVVIRWLKADGPGRPAGGLRNRQLQWARSCCDDIEAFKALRMSLRNRVAAARRMAGYAFENSVYNFHQIG